MRQRIPATPDVIFDSACRVVKPGQLRSCECGWLMAPAQANRHLLVYRCEVERCGNHYAHITDIDAGLLREYRAWLARFTLDAYTRSERDLIVEAYAHLVDAWSDNGRLHQARFSSTTT